MTYKDLFQKWGLTKIVLKAGFASAEFKPEDGDREAAWEMYVELLTRIATQPLEAGTGDEKTALTSIYSLFPTTRSILKEKGRRASQFTRVAIIVLNQIVRPFTAKWHHLSINGAFDNKQECDEFRRELEALVDCVH